MGKKNLHNSKLKKDYKNKICSKSAGKKLHNKAFALLFASGVFSTGATGAIAPAILRKRPIAPVILPGMYPQGQLLRPRLHPNFADNLNKKIPAIF